LLIIINLISRVEDIVIVRDDDVVIVENQENDKNDKKVVEVDSLQSDDEIVRYYLKCISLGS